MVDSMNNDHVFIPIPDNRNELDDTEKDAVVEKLLIGLASKLRLPTWVMRPAPATSRTS
jgi:hypothetical protein